VPPLHNGRSMMGHAVVVRAFNYYYFQPRMCAAMRGTRCLIH
jgi:hypothetical protein